MITLYSGIPGSGKSYKMVYDLVEAKKTWFIIHNIEGLKPEVLADKSQGLNFLDYCTENDIEVIEFFSKENQISLTEQVRIKYGKNCLVIVDEAHEWFDKNKKDLKMWLSFHRHLNQNIWLVAHRSTNLPAVYRSFIELEFRAKSGSVLQIPGYFIYNKIVGGERIGYTFTRKKQEVFNLYKSMAPGFDKKKISLFLPVVALICIAGVLYFFYAPQRAINKSKKSSDKPMTEVENRAGLKQIVTDQFSYAGSIGDICFVQEIESRRIISVEEMPGVFIVMRKTKNELLLFDTLLQKNVSIRSFVPAVPKNPDSKSLLNTK